MTQSDLADRVEVRTATISDIERGENLPDIETLLKMADCLQGTTDELLGRAPAPADVDETVSRLKAGPVADAIRALQRQINLLKGEMRSHHPPAEAKSSRSRKGRHTG